MRLHVSRNASGTLLDGIEALLTRVDAVRTVEEMHVSTVAPRLNDMAVEATVTMTVETGDDDSAAVEALLADGFGVQTVDVRELEGVP